MQSDINNELPVQESNQVFAVHTSTEGEVHDENYIPPSVFYIKRHIPWMIIFMILMVFATGIGTSYVYFHVTTSAKQTLEEQQIPLTQNPEADIEQELHARASFRNIFSPPTAVAYDNPFAIPTPTAYKNPFDDYQNPFALASGGEREFINPFAKGL